MQILGVEIPVKRRDPHYFLPTTGVICLNVLYLATLLYTAACKFNLHVEVDCILVACTA